MNAKEKNEYVDVSLTSRKLVRLILSESYVSGSHIDYYDSIEGIDTPSEKTTCCSCDYCTCGVDCKCKEVKSPQCNDCGDFVLSKK